METTVKEGKYIYCIIRAGKPESFGPMGIGGRGDKLYTIHFNDIAAVVSDAPIMVYRLSRENMLAHEKAIEEVMKKHTVLPVRFSTITENENKVKKILEKEYSKFKELLNTTEGKKELGLKAVFNRDIVYRDIVKKYNDIKTLKEKVASLSPEKTYYQRMEIGKMVEDALQKEKAIYKKEILDNLSPLAIEVKDNNTYGELMIINAAFLIENHKEKEFDQTLNELAEKYGDTVRFKYVGKIPPFNFVNLIITTEKN